jgi:hypothetical protein
MHTPPNAPPPAGNTIARVFLAVSGFLITAVSIPCVAAMIHDLATQAPNANGALLVGGFFGILGIGGIIMMFLSWRLKPQAAPAYDYRQMERTILGLAQHRGGMLTAAEVGLHTPLTAEEGQRILEGLARQGAAQMDISAQGELVFTFPAFQQRAQNFSVDNDVSFEFQGSDGEQQQQQQRNAAPTFNQRKG